LQYFAKVVDGVVVVNPGTVSKKASAGTFARLYISPKDLSNAMDMDAMKADVWERCRVDLHRI
jgi:DNA polymerase alpha subunit B